MKKTVRQTTACWLLGAMLLSACASTADKASDSAADTTTASLGEEVAETTLDPNDRSHIKDSVPEGLRFDGETVNVLFRGNGNGIDHIEIYDTIGTDNHGDYVTDGVWLRNRKVEERLGITLNFSPSMAGGLEETKALVQKLVMSGSDEYDYLNMTGNTSIDSGLNGSLRDLSALPYVDYSEPWWWNYAIEATSVDGKTYNYIFGDILINGFIKSGVIFYNKNLYGDIYGDTEAPYGLVMDGTWTIDKLSELTAGAYKDANGDGIENAGDIFGALKTKTQGEESQHFVVGFDIDTYTRGEDGELLIEFDQARASTAVGKLAKFYHETAGVYHSEQMIDGASIDFVGGDVLFLPSRLAHAMSNNLRTMEDEYGILPFPKLDTEQENYVNLVHESASTICILKSVSDERFTLVGAALEAMCAETYRSVTPLLIETALKTKYSRDTMSGKVIDIVLATVTKSLLMEYKTYTGNIISCLMTPAIDGSGNFASLYAQKQPAAQRTWGKLLSKINK